MARGSTRDFEGVVQLGVGVAVGVEGPWVAPLLAVGGNVPDDQLAARICGRRVGMIRQQFIV